jgi:hypothetical protein
VVELSPDLYPEGRVLEALCSFNFIGNGSALLMPREVFERAGGFEPRLHAQGAQGCEDYLFQLRAAEHYEFRAVKRRLVGYRVSEHNMSSNTYRMWKSLSLVCDEYKTKYPGLRNKFEFNLYSMMLYFVYRAAQAGDTMATLYFIMKLGIQRPGKIGTLIPSIFRTLLARLLFHNPRRQRSDGEQRMLYSDQSW